MIVTKDHDVNNEDFENKAIFVVVPPGGGLPSGLEEHIFPFKAPPTPELQVELKTG